MSSFTFPDLWAAGCCPSHSPVRPSANGRVYRNLWAPVGPGPAGTGPSSPSQPGAPIGAQPRVPVCQQGLTTCPGCRLTRQLGWSWGASGNRAGQARRCLSEPKPRADLTADSASQTRGWGPPSQGGAAPATALTGKVHAWGLESKVMSQRRGDALP